METKFKGILQKFMESTHSMEEVYTELTYLTTNYDKEIEKIHKELNDERAKANNEEFMRKEAEKSLSDMKALQQINFSVIVNDLIEKPKEEFNSNVKSGIKKFTFSVIIIALLSSLLSVSITYLYLLNINPTTTTATKPIDNSKEFEKLLLEIKKENKELKTYIKENMKQPKVKQETSKEEKKTEETIENEVKEIINSDKPELSIENKEELTEKVLLSLQNYDKKFKLNSKNDSRILYKMFMLDLAPFKHDIFLQELKLFAKKGTYVPSMEEIKIWDNQMLHIYTKMLEKFENTSKAKRTEQMRLFYNYKENDATQYQGWEYVGEEGLNIKESLKKEIEKLNAQIVLNDT